jgi:hypothetical protein
MSKKKSKKKQQSNIKKPKKKNLKSLIILICVCVAICAVIVVSYFIYMSTSLEGTDFANTIWRSKSAYDASADEVDITTVYNNRYDNYQGSLTLKSSGEFEFWMSPGDPEDGTHKGDYTYDREKEQLSATFDSGEEATFKIIRNSDNTIDHIEVPYEDYTVWFYLSDT